MAEEFDEWAEMAVDGIRDLVEDPGSEMDYSFEVDEREIERRVSIIAEDRKRVEKMKGSEGELYREMMRGELERLIYMLMFRGEYLPAKRVRQVLEREYFEVMVAAGYGARKDGQPAASSISLVDIEDMARSGWLAQWEEVMGNPETRVREIMVQDLAILQMLIGKLEGEVRMGNFDVVGDLLATLKRRSSLVGADAPARIQVGLGSSGMLSDADVAAARAALAEVGQWRTELAAGGELVEGMILDGEYEEADGED